MQYGFVLDHDRCIGCHACTVACKAENDVPVGDFRTWVKYTEQGVFPDVRRSFAVLRCNHCSNAPCVTICPVNALEKRGDGIVDIDRDACIGCRACMQACPYDAIYLNDDQGAVEKCHFCAHRIEQGLEPACVIVCPENAIIPGDVHDPNSRAAELIRENDVVVRRSEQGTGPNVYYKGVNEVALHPGAAARPDMYLWSDRPPHKPEKWPLELALAQDTTVVLDAGHRVEWGWHVSAYLVTKGLAAGAAMLAPFVSMFSLNRFGGRFLPEILAVLFTIITCILLVDDLARPMRFYRLLTRPNWKSWLVKGGIILGLFGGIESLILLLNLVQVEGPVLPLRIAGAIIALGVAGYTAFLFAQCKGRDLWESNMLLPHLLVQAVMCGSAALLPAAAGSLALKLTLVASTITHVGLAIFEKNRAHETTNARQAAAFLATLRLGPLNAWRGGLIITAVLGIALAFIAPWVAFVPVLFGLYMYEHAFVRAGQLPPLS